MRLLVSLVAALVACSPAHAQDAPHERQARDIYARLIGFRTAAGHGQVPAMANYIAETLRTSANNSPTSSPSSCARPSH